MIRWSLSAPSVYVLTLVWAACILWMSSASGRDLPRVEFNHADKLAHLLVYAMLTVFVAYSFKELGLRQALLASVVLASGYGLAMEIMQGAFFPHRHFDAYDVLANVAGAIVGIVIISKIDRTF